MATIQPARDHLLEITGGGMAAMLCDLLSRSQFNSLARSLALCQRSSGSLARHFLTIRSRPTGVMGCS